MRNEGRNAVMARLGDHFVRLMRNWAMSDSRSGTYAMTAAYSGMQAYSGYAQSSVPFLAGEAEDVEAALAGVPAQERSVVRVFWQFEGMSLPWLARRCGMDYRTFRRRVDRGHEMLRAELALQRERRERIRQESMRAILLTRTAV